MNCKCGYRFQEHVLDKPQPYKSYGVVFDADWQHLMKIESKILARRGERKRIELIAEASEFVGSLMECPECWRLTLLRPGGKSPRETYVLEKAEPATQQS